VTDSARSVFEGVFDLDGEERARELERLCGGDAALRRAVDALLDAHDRAGPFLSEVTAPSDAPQGEAEAVRIAGAGHLVIERELGRGAFGVVYLARDEQLARQVALKVVHTADTDPAPFLAEARLVAQLQSPHIVTLLRLHESDGEITLEMEYVPRGTLDDIIASGRPLPAARVREMLHGVLAGLGAAHDAGILHRDVKPANVLLAADGAPRLTDFGLALTVSDLAGATEALGPVGTPSYMAPEILLGGSASIASDLWSIGVLAYELACGEPPFPRTDMSSLFRAVQSAAYEPPRDIDPGVARVIERCLVADPDARAQSSAELLDILDRPLATLAPRDDSVAPLFGRESETDRIDGWIREGRAGLVLVTGEPGVGKTALLVDARRRVREHGRHWCDLELTAAGGLAGGLHSALHRALPSESPAVFAEAAEAALNRWSGGAPADLCCDQVEHLQADELALLTTLVRRLAGSGWRIWVGARPGAATELADVDGSLRIELEGLAAEALYSLLEERAGVALPPELAQTVAERCASNPRFGVELLAELEASGAIVREADRFTLRQGWREQALPARFRDLAETRIARLAEEDRLLLEVAAVDGVEVEGQAVAAVAGLPLLATLRHLQRLCRAPAVLRTAPSGYLFATPILQEALYEQIAPELRTATHRALAEHLEPREEIDPKRLARHWTACGEAVRARPYLLQASQEAAQAMRRRECLGFARQAGLLEADCADDLLIEQATLVERVASALLEEGERDAALSLLERLAHAARDRGDEELALRSLVRRERVELTTKGRADEALLRDCAERLANTRAGADANLILGTALKRRNELEEAAEFLQRAIKQLERLDDVALRSAAVDQLGSVALRRKQFDEAAALYAEAADLADRAGRRGNAASSRVNLAIATLSAGKLEGAKPALERAIRTLALEGHRSNAAQTRWILAKVREAEGDLAGAKREIETALPVLRETRNTLALAHVLLDLGLLSVATGDADDAATLLAEARALAVEQNNEAFLAEVVAAQAQIAMLRGRRDEAATRLAELAPPLTSATAHSAALALLWEAPRPEWANRVDGEEVGHLLFRVVDGLADEAREATDLAAMLESIRVVPVAYVRAAHTVISHFLAGKIATRRGDVDAARREFEDGLAGAVAMGHAPLEARIRAAGDGLPPE